jgi:acyl-coenzyme A synthetase/AMP-(fatty) acid ligase
VRNVLAPLLSGGSVICCGGFDPLLFWDTLVVHKVTWYYASPTMHHAILSEAANRYG